MATQLSDAQKQAIQEQGYGFTGFVGGIKKKRYYTPDGRIIIAVPSIRDYVIKDKLGNVIESGTRDANFDNGWLEQPPQVPKLRCSYCDKWHDTQEEIDKCGKNKKAFDAKWMKRAKKENKEDEGDDRVAKLESEMSEIKDMLKQLLKRGE